MEYSCSGKILNAKASGPVRITNNGLSTIISIHRATVGLCLLWTQWPYWVSPVSPTRSPSTARPLIVIMIQIPRPSKCLEWAFQYWRILCCHGRRNYYFFVLIIIPVFIALNFIPCTVLILHYEVHESWEAHTPNLFCHTVDTMHLLLYG